MASITRYIIPQIAILSTKSVYAVLIFEIVWLFWSPEPKFTYFSVCPHE